MDTSTVVILLVAALAVIVVGLLLIRRNSNRVQTPEPAPGRAFSLGAALNRAFGGGGQSGWDSVEETLLAADVGVEVTERLIEGAKARKPGSPGEVVEAIGAELKAVMAGKDRDLHVDGSPAVVLIVGVNGSGKTTSIAKLAKRQLDSGRTVILGAGDTFRAAAGEQLQTWGERLGVRVVVGQEGGDPASVAYDTIDAAKAGGVDVAIIDTAGRLHGKQNLMAELGKIHRVAGGSSIAETLIVLDATAGQNGLAQVEAFSDVVDVTGVVLTKLDGTARGGIVVAVEQKLGVPVKFVGVGEGSDDLIPFDPDSFVADLMEGA